MTVGQQHQTSSRRLRAIALRVHCLVVLLALIALLAFPVGATTTFADPQGRFSFQVPDGWQPDSAALNPGIIVQYITANPNGAFNITATPLPDGITIDAVPALIVAQLQKQFSDFQQTNIGPATVAGEQGTEVDYTATPSAGTLLATSQILVAHNGTLYLLTLAAQPADISAIQTAGAPILLSWQWLS